MNLYFDNAATSFPKPEPVYCAAELFLRTVAGNPGRAGHKRSLDAYRLIYSLREKLATLFNSPEPAQIVFTLNATDSLNMAIKGFVKQGDNVVHTAMEHNSVLRPLGGLVRRGIITTTTIPCSNIGLPDLEFLEKSITSKTTLLVINHASNVCGTILPIKEMIKIAHEKGVTVLIDAAQTAGVLPIDVQESDIDMLAFTGHKGLLGHPGTGGLYLKQDLDLAPWREGGTGSSSHKDSQPDTLPEKFEAGTLNSSGLAGLKAGVEYILDTGIDKIREKEISTHNYLHHRLLTVPKIKLHGVTDSEQSVSVLSFTIDGMDCGELGFLLEEKGVLCRTGIHCAPLAHKALGTYPEGTVRLSPGFFTSFEDIDYLIDSLVEITNI